MRKEAQREFLEDLCDKINSDTKLLYCYMYSLVTNSDDTVDWTMNVFPGAPVLLATQW